MPGSPTKRARREAEAAAVAPPLDTIREAVPNARAHDAPARAPARSERAAPPRPERPAPGPAVRGAIDAQQAAAVNTLAHHLRPGLTLRIERTRPTWCAGYLEDFTIEPGEGLADVYAHVQDEWGGQRYRLQVLNGPALMFEGAITIADQPKKHGRVIRRDDWDGTGERSTNPRATAAPPAQTSALGDFGQVLAMFLDQQNKNSAAVLEAVTRSQEASRATTETLMTAVLQRREDERQSGDFGAQVAKLAEGIKTMQRAQKLFGSAAPKAPNDDHENRDALKEMTSQFLTAAIGTHLTKSMAPSPPAMPVQPAKAQMRAAPGPRNPSSSIPDARPHSGRNGSNSGN